jgi:hypothetical protein
MPLTVAQVIERASHGRPLQDYHVGTVVKGGGSMGLIRDYSYVLEAEPGSDFDPKFAPVLTPAEMLFMGVFGGKYLNDCTDEFPKEWFLLPAAAGKLSPEATNIACNYFGVDSRQGLSIWKEKGWAPTRGKQAAAGATGRAILADSKRNPDERGWFQWYCRYWLGRRIPDLDAVQIGRWRSFARHAGAVRKGCKRGDLDCRRRERQALLQWAYDPFI